MTDVVNKFASAKHLQGNAQAYPQNYDTKMYTLIAANTPPDAAYLTEPMSMQ
ncbi:hypothetical protein IAE22_35615, partial [Bacillus sp. S34]|nr:hypothetical protein [Bacillus sp. S34]